MRLAVKLFSAILFLIVFAGDVRAIDFDNTFGTGGKFLTSFADTGQPSSSGMRVYVQPSGRIVVVGRHQQQGNEGRMSGVVMAGLTSAGALDSAFGTAGKVFNWSFISSRTLVDSLMLPDGSILILSQFLQLASTNYPSLLKYTPNGQIDGTFNSNLQIGVNTTVPVVFAHAAGGKIYVVVRQTTQYSIIRLNADGSRDMTFGPDGVQALNLNRFPQPTIFGLDEVEGGKLLVTGHHETRDGSVSFAARLNSDVTLDRSFGVQGVTRMAIAWGSALGQTTIVQPDGKILIGGYYTFLGSNALLIRLTARGRPDAGFGNSGVAMTAFNNWNGVLGVAVAPDGKIIAVCHCGAKSFPPNERLFVARFSATGVRESHIMTNFITSRDAAAFDIALQSDGKMLIAAFTRNESDNFNMLAAARFVP